MARNDIGYDSKAALPNKLILDDGSVTDIAGKPVAESTDLYKSKPALPNKLLNPDGSYTTLNEIIGAMIDTNIFVLVDELPATGLENKIYVVPNKDQTGFDEYMWNGVQWNSIGMIEFDLDAYSTREETEQLIATALNEAKTYVDTKISELDTGSQVFYWDGNTEETGLELWNEVWQMQKTKPCVIIHGNYYFNMYNQSISTNVFSLAGYRAVRTQNTASSSLVGGYQEVIDLTYNSKTDTISAVTITEMGGSRSVLDTETEYQTPYNPKYPGSPATKKYVDDTVSDTTQIFEYSFNTPAESPKSFWTDIINKTQLKNTMVVYKEPNVENYWTMYLEKGYFEGKSDVVLTFIPTKTMYHTQNSNTDITTDIKQIRVKYANWVVTEVTNIEVEPLTAHVLETDKNYAEIYTPMYPGSPATKKYVDDNAGRLQLYVVNTQYKAGDLLYNIRETNDLVYLFTVIRDYTSRNLEEDLSLGNILRVGIPNEIYDPENATYDDLFTTASKIMETSIENDTATVDYTNQEKQDCLRLAYNILGENPPR